MTTILKPSIEGVLINPNPVNHNTAFLIQVSVSEIEAILEPTIIYCGIFYCGEDGQI